MRVEEETRLSDVLAQQLHETERRAKEIQKLHVESEELKE
jgi:hypothetical protein